MERRFEAQLHAGEKFLAPAKTYLKAQTCTMNWKRCGKLQPLDISPHDHILWNHLHDNELTKLPLHLFLIWINAFCFCLETIFILKGVSSVLMLSFPILESFYGQGAGTEMLRGFCFPVQDTSHQPEKLLKGAVWMTEVLSDYGTESGTAVKPQHGFPSWGTSALHCEGYTGFWLQNQMTDIHYQHCQAIICLKW